MTVAELIEKLQECPPTMRVLTVGDEYNNVVVENHIYADKELELACGCLTDCVGVYIGPPTP